MYEVFSDGVQQGGEPAAPCARLQPDALGFTCSDSGSRSRILEPNWIQSEPPVTRRWLEGQHQLLGVRNEASVPSIEYKV